MSARANDDLEDGISRGLLTKVQRAIAAGADVNQKNPFGWPMLAYTYRTQNDLDKRLPIFKALIDAGADVNDSITVSEIVYFGGVEFIEALLEKGMVPTPKHVYTALDRKKNDIAKMILTYHPDLAPAVIAYATEQGRKNIADQVTPILRNATYGRRGAGITSYAIGDMNGGAHRRTRRHKRRQSHRRRRGSQRRR